MPTYSTVKSEIIERWKIAASLDSITTENYSPEIAIINDISGKSEYTFGVIINENRFKRPGIIDGKNDDVCYMCEAVKRCNDDTRRNLLPISTINNFALTSNKFPIHQGISLAIHSGLDENEIPMYTTRDLNGLSTELETMLKLSKATGFELFHNSPGFGASIPKHEHWHLTNFRGGYDLVGKMYGFDASDKLKLKKVEGVYVMPDFPFALLIFSKDNIDKIANVLKKIDADIGDKFNGQGIPHTISEWFDGILLCVGKEYRQKSIGSGDVAGHLVRKSKEDLSLSYDNCLKIVDEVLPKKEDLNLIKYL